MQINRVLLIDDDVNIRLIAQIGLEEVGGWEVMMAGSGAEGLEMASNQPPDLVLLDVMMPLMDGPDTLLKLRQDPSLSTVPVIFLTAKTRQDEVEHYKSLGAIGVISKPFDPLTLPDAIMAIVETD